MSVVQIKPWIGDNYRAAALFGKRVLILGESCYQRNANSDMAEYTRNSVLEQITVGEPPYKFWTNIVMAFLKRKPSFEDKKAFWHSMAFHNYVQEPVGQGPRISPKPHMWADGRDAFNQVLGDLQPQCIIVLGYRLWRQLCTIHSAEGPVIVGASRPSTRYIPFGCEQRTLAYAIRHPSSGFSSGNEYPHIMRAIAVA